MVTAEISERLLGKDIEGEPEQAGLTSRRPPKRRNPTQEEPFTHQGEDGEDRQCQNPQEPTKVAERK